MQDITISRRVFRIGAALCIAAVLALGFLAPRALSMVIAGSAAAIVLSYPLALLERLMPRAVALTAILLTLLAVLAVLIVLLIPQLLLQATNFANDLPLLAQKADARLTRFLSDLSDRGVTGVDPEAIMKQVREEFLSRVGALGERLASGSIGVLQTLAALTIQTLGSIFIAAYLLVDAPKLRALFVRSAPATYRQEADDLWDAASRSLSRYFVSLLVVGVIQGAAASLFLSFLDVPYPLVFGSWIGLASTIPYVGTWIGGVPPIVVTAIQSSPQQALAVFAFFFATTTIIGNVITPRLQGQAIDVHPVIVLLAVIAAGEWFGVLGMFLAVPVLAVGKVGFDFVSPRLQVSE